ncbi:hypothetical protein AB0F88_21790 [Streptosporangium sp. NPDC023963]|uniref:hypothetical protein n=1 Tax=Streptosporangium sp. NPDC023963 TaxID=3155608 RepID=UPI003430472A
MRTGTPAARDVTMADTGTPAARHVTDVTMAEAREPAARDVAATRTGTPGPAGASRRTEAGR